jgi:hypothetical protein
MQMNYSKFSSLALSIALLSACGVRHCFAQEAVAQAVPQAGTAVEKIEASSRPLNLTVELTNGNTLTGTLIEADVVNIKTAFGEAGIPLSEIAGIRFATREDVTTTVVMINGDSITGATDVKLVTVETEWGTAKINGSAIQSLLLIPNLKWQSNNGVSGKRWVLVDSKAAESTAQTLSTLSTGSNQSSTSIQSAATNRTLPNSVSSPTTLPSPLPSGTYYQNGVLYRSGATSQE